MKVNRWTAYMYVVFFGMIVASCGCVYSKTYSTCNASIFHCEKINDSTLVQVVLYQDASYKVTHLW